jgi:hypothetical protein
VSNTGHKHRFQDSECQEISEKKNETKKKKY